MVNYAVIKIKGNQYRVSEGEEILVDKLVESKVEGEILLVVKNGKVKIGKPNVKGAKVRLKVVNKEEKGRKLYVHKFKAKSRYRRKYGIRPFYTRILAEKII